MSATSLPFGVLLALLLGSCAAGPAGRAERADEVPAAGPSVAAAEAPPPPIPEPPEGCRPPTARPIVEARGLSPESDERVVLLAGGRLVVLEHDAGQPEGGAIYDPERDGWTPVARRGAPRYGTPMDGPMGMLGVFVLDHRVATLWTNQGQSPRFQGALLDTRANRWTVMDTAGAPETFPSGPRVAVAGALVVFPSGDLAAGLRYDADRNRFRPVAAEGAPAHRDGQIVAAVGRSVVVWGGSGSSEGAVYDLAADRWRPMTVEGAPSPRRSPYVAADRGRLVVYGGVPEAGRDNLDDGGVYHVAEDRWEGIPAEGAPDVPPGSSANEGLDVTFTPRGLVYREHVTDSRGDPRRLAFFDLASRAWSRVEVYGHAHVHPLEDGRVVLLGPGEIRVVDPAAGRVCPIDASQIPTLGWGPPPPADRPEMVRFEGGGTSFLFARAVGRELWLWGRVDEMAGPDCPPGAPCMDSAPMAAVGRMDGVRLTF